MTPLLLSGIPPDLSSHWKREEAMVKSSRIEVARITKETRLGKNTSLLQFAFICISAQATRRNTSGQRMGAAFS